MPEYLRPDVYIEDRPAAPVIERLSASTAGFIGYTERGKVGKPFFCNSWQAFVNEFARGKATPFLANSDLAYAVYGFYQNGGKRCFVNRVAGTSVAKAEQVDTTVSMLFEPKDEGTWGNGLSVAVIANDDVVGTFDVIVKVDGSVVDVFSRLSNDVDNSNYWKDQINFLSGDLVAVSGNLEVTTADLTFTGGADGLSDISDNTYIMGLAGFDDVDDLNILAIPGQYSASVLNALTGYTDNRKYVFAVLEAPKTTTKQNIKAIRQSLNCKTGALYYPWIKIADPLSSTSRLRDCPAAGHLAGIIARTIVERGIHKAPAGVECNVRGAVDLLQNLNDGDSEIFNPSSINLIRTLTNYGNVVWGARSLHPDSSMRYVSDIILDMNIKKSIYNGTKQFVFEPNGHDTWRKVRVAVSAFLQLLWLDGSLFGETPQEAYFVKCDEETNPEEARNAGRLYCQVGYASLKPAEFVIFTFFHELKKES